GHRTQRPQDRGHCPDARVDPREWRPGIQTGAGVDRRGLDANLSKNRLNHRPRLQRLDLPIHRVRFGLSQVVVLWHPSMMNTLATEAEVDNEGWLKIRAPAPPGTAPGRLDVVIVWSPPVQQPGTEARPRAGTLPGKVELAPDFHASLEDFRPYME